MWSQMSGVEKLGRPALSYDSGHSVCEMKSWMKKTNTRLIFLYLLLCVCVNAEAVDLGQFSCVSSGLLPLCLCFSAKTKNLL